MAIHCLIGKHFWLHSVKVYSLYSYNRMWYKIAHVLLIALISSVSSLTIEDCGNKTTKIKTVCKLIETYEMDYPPQPLPSTLEVDIVIIDIVDLDWTSNTVSSFIQLWAFWKDPRITISNYVSEEIKEEG